MSVLLALAATAFCENPDGHKGSNRLYDLAFDEDYLWLATNCGVIRWNSINKTAIKFTKQDGLVDNNVRAIAFDKDGYKWFGTGGGVSRFNGSYWTTYTMEDGLVYNYVRSIAIDSHGNKWFGTYRGLSRFDGIAWTTFTTENGLVYDYVRAIAVDRDGSLWLGTGGGLGVFDGRKWRSYTKDQGLEYNYVRSIAIDTDGNKWLATATLSLGGTWGRGVTRFDGTTWTRYSVENGLISDDVAVSAIDADGNLWVGTSAGVSRFDGTGWRAYTVKDGLVDNDVRAIAMDQKGSVWFGSYRGVTRFDGSRWKEIKIPGFDILCNPPKKQAAEPLSGSKPVAKNINPTPIKENNTTILLPGTGKGESFSDDLPGNYLFTVHIGSYGTKGEAYSTAMRFAKKGDPAFTTYAIDPEKGRVNQVFMGNFKTLQQVKKKVRALKKRRFRKTDIVSRRFAVQLGDCSSYNVTEEIGEKLRLQVHVPYTIPCEAGYGQAKVLVGAFLNEKAAGRLAEDLQKTGSFSQVRVVLR